MWTISNVYKIPLNFSAVFFCPDVNTMYAGGDFICMVKGDEIRGILQSIDGQ